MRALMNLAIEPALKLFEVSTVLAAAAGARTVRIVKVLAATPEGAVRIVRERYPHLKRPQVVAMHPWVQGLA